MARGRIKPVSDKKRKRDAANKPMLDAYREKFPLCECGCGRVATSIHEMLGGPLRQIAREHASCILHLNEIPCHRAIQYWEKARQLALKKISGSGYDLDEFNRIRGNQPVQQSEVDAWEKELRAA